MSTSTLRLPPRTAKNYDDQICHRFYSIADQVETTLDRWVSDKRWTVQLAINEADEREETLQPSELVKLVQPVPANLTEFHELMQHVLLDTSSTTTQFTILDKIIDPPFRTSPFLDRTLTLTRTGSTLLSLYHRPADNDSQLKVKLTAASALAKLSIGVDRLQVTDQFLIAIGVDKFWHDLPELFMNDLFPLCTSPSDQTECIRILTMSFRGLAEKNPRPRHTVHAFFTLYKRLIEDQETPSETLEAVCDGLAEILGVAPYDPSWFQFIADVFHQIDPYSTLIALIQKDPGFGTSTIAAVRAQMSLKCILEDEDLNPNADPADPTEAKEFKSRLDNRRKSFLKAGGGVVVRLRFINMIKEDTYDTYSVMMMMICGETEWASVFEMEDVDMLATALYQDGTKRELLRTFRAFLDHPEALKRCQTMRFYRPVINDLHQEYTYSQAALTLVNMFSGHQAAEAQDAEWFTTLTRIVCANIRTAYDDDLARIATISLFRIIIALDEAQIETLRQVKLETLLFLWSHDIDQPEAINAMAGKLVSTLYPEKFEVGIELIEKGLQYLDQFEQKPIPLSQPPGESVDEAVGTAKGNDEGIPERSIKETTRDVVTALQRRGLLQCRTFGFEPQNTDSSETPLPVLFTEYFNYSREKSDQVYAAGVPLLAVFALAKDANANELKALEPGICNVAIEYSMDDLPRPPKIRWTKAEKKQRYHQYTSLEDPKQVEDAHGSVFEDDNGSVEVDEVLSDKDVDQGETDYDGNEDDGNSDVAPSDSDVSVDDVDDPDEEEPQEVGEAEQMDDDNVEHDPDDTAADSDAEEEEVEASEVSEGVVKEEVEPEVFAKEAKDRNLHDGISCDGCGKAPIAGTRYKCKQCADHDLCADCHDTASFTHPEHTWHTIENDGDYDPEQGMAEFLTKEDKAVKLGAHPGIECVQCKRSPIYNTRSQCGACNANYCSSCVDNRKIECKVNGGQCFYFMTIEPPQLTEGGANGAEAEQAEEVDDDLELDGEANVAEDDPQAEDEDNSGAPGDLDDEEEETFEYPPDIVTLAKTVTAILWALRGTEENVA